MFYGHPCSRKMRSHLQIMHVTSSTSTVLYRTGKERRMSGPDVAFFIGQGIRLMAYGIENIALFCMPVDGAPSSW